MARSNCWEIEIAMDWEDPNSYFSHKNLYRFTDAPPFTNNYMAHSIFTSHYWEIMRCVFLGIHNFFLRKSYCMSWGESKTNVCKEKILLSWGESKPNSFYK
jgi:hypothetical protein